MKRAFADCPCQQAIGTERKGRWNEFRRIRKQCPALRKVLVPEAIWPQYQEACNALPDKARHRSIFLLALERGYLDRITSPIHRYLLTNDKPKNQLTNQYRQDRTSKNAGFGRIMSLSVTENQRFFKEDYMSCSALNGSRNKDGRLLVWKHWAARRISKPCHQMILRA